MCSALSVYTLTTIINTSFGHELPQTFIVAEPCLCNASAIE